MTMGGDDCGTVIATVIIDGDSTAFEESEEFLYSTLEEDEEEEEMGLRSPADLCHCALLMSGGGGVSFDLHKNNSS